MHPLDIRCAAYSLTTAIINGCNGHIVEADPIAGKQTYTQQIDGNRAQSQSGNGDLFGLAVRPDGKSFHYVRDGMMSVMEAT